MDRVSQGMIDGCANYSGYLEVEARCNDCTAAIDAHISYRIASGLDDNDVSLIVVQQRAGLSDAQQRANVKLAIFGGQNEPKDTIAGIIWAILERHTVLKALQAGTVSYLQVFEEFTHWISPIGMSLRCIAKPYITMALTLSKMSARFLFFPLQAAMKHILTIQTNLIHGETQANPYHSEEGPIFAQGLGRRAHSL